MFGIYQKEKYLEPDILDEEIEYFDDNGTGFIDDFDEQDDEFVDED